MKILVDDSIQKSFMTNRKTVIVLAVLLIVTIGSYFLYKKYKK